MWQLTAKLGKHKGASWPISEDPLVIGRSVECTIVVRDAQVSRLHCRIVKTDEAIVCEDMGSSNATLVNGRPIKRHVLRMGDEISLGNAVFIVSRVPEDDSDVKTPFLDGTTVNYFSLHRDGIREGVPTQTLSAKPRNVSDLLSLHDLSLRLGATENHEEAARIIASSAAAAIPVERCILLLQSAVKSILAVSPDGSTIEGSAVHLLKEALVSDSQVLAVPPERSEGTQARYAFVIPIRNQSKTLGAMWLQFEASSVVNHQDELGFALSIVRTAAPFLREAQVKPAGSPRATSVPHLDESDSMLVGSSAAMTRIRRIVSLAAKAELPVIIQGETGTGKELVARQLHRLSARSKGPFVAVNCAAIPDSLFESEMFGHAKGAFTGASHARIGLLAEAHRGVLFLDELADLSLHAQARLLRALETGTFRPVGGDSDVTVDIWIVTASNRDMLQAVENKQFREDLYYRVSGIEIFNPPLRERRDDIPKLIAYFAEEYEREKRSPKPQFGDAEVAYLASAPWPGNVRELRNSVRRIAALFPAAPITISDLELIVRRPGDSEGESQSVRDIERAHIKKVLDEAGGSMKDAARILGIHRNTLREKMKQYNL